jgi:cyclohexanecarboxylate-CoA ligase/acyl-CoA synthetase
VAIEIRSDAERLARYRAAGYWRDDTLRDWLDAHARERPGHDALRQGDRRVTWAELRRLARAFQSALDGLGIRKGDVIAVQLPNIVEFVVAYLAIAGRGAVMQTLHMPYRAAELETLLGHSGAVAAVVLTQAKDYAAAEVVLGLRPKLPALKHVIAVGAAAAGALAFADPVAGGGTREPAPVALSGADPFLLLYTSGTTAAPKGAPHAYQALLGNARLSAEALGIGPDDVLLSAAPFTHLYGLFTCTLPIVTGATSLLLPAFSPPDLAALMHTGRPTAAFAAPAHIAACFAQKLFDGKDLSSLRYLQMSGSAVPAALARAFEPLMRGGKVMQLWGMTELQAGAYTRLADAEPVRAETTGRPSPGTELRVVRDDGSAAPTGEEGELQVRGASVFTGYLNDPESTRAAFTADGWFRTGDLATMDADGNTRLAGRTKDVINRGGIKFNPLDVETLLLKHPAIEQAAIVPMPDSVLGEKACLFVTLKPGVTLTLAEVTDWLDAAQVTKLKWPERLEIVDAMPLTPTRKVIKGQLVKRLAD